MHISAAESLIATEPDLDQPRVQAAVLAGSLVAGLGHSQSDVDLLVVVDNTEAIRPPRRYTSHGHQIDVEWFTHSELEAIATRAQTFVATKAGRSQLSISIAEQKQLVGFTIGTRLLARGGAEALLDSISPSVVRQLLMSRAAMFIGAFAEDVLGAIQSADWFLGLEASRIALLRGVELGLAGAADIYVGDKFVFRRMAACSAFDALRDVIWSAAHTVPHPEDAASLAALAQWRLRLAAHIAGQALVFGWDSPVDAYKELTPPANGLDVSPYFGLVRFSDGLGLAGPGQGYDVTSDVALLWWLMQGVTKDQAIESFLTYRSLDPESDPTAIDAAIARLKKIAAIVDLSSN